MKLRLSLSTCLYVLSGAFLLVAGGLRWEVAKGHIRGRESECIVLSRASTIRFENLLADRFLEDCGRIGGLVRSIGESQIELFDGSRLLMAPHTELRIDGVFENQALINLRLGEVTIQAVSGQGYYVKSEDPLRRIDAGMVGERLSAKKVVSAAKDSVGATRKVAQNEEAPAKKPEPTLATLIQVDPADKSIVFFDQATTALINIVNSSDQFCTFSLLRDGHPYQSIRTPAKEIAQIELDLARYSGEVNWVLDQCANTQEKLTGAITIEKISPAAFEKAISTGHRIIMLE